MTSREEIREGIEQPIDLLFKKHNYGYSQHAMDICVKQIRQNLHSQGLVIKVDRELPAKWVTDFPVTVQWLTVAGYTAWEPLVEEMSNG